MSWLSRIGQTIFGPEPPSLPQQQRDSGQGSLTEGGYNLENPRTSWDRIFEVEPTYSGKQVTEFTAMQATAVWACVRIIAGAIGRVPLITYRQSDEGKVRAKNHYLWPLFMMQANPYVTAYRFRRMMQAWLCLWGNAYAEMEISGRGQVTNLWPWRPDRVRVTGEIPTDPVKRANGEGLFYTYTLANGSTYGPIPGHRMLHLRGLETDGVMGLSPVKVCRQSIGLGQAAEEYGARYFGNNGKPGGFITTPVKLGAEGRKNLRESWEDLHRGLRGAHRMAILEEGMKYVDVGIPPEDMQFLQTRQFQAIDIARIYGVPPHMIAELSRATFSNIEHQGIEFVKLCLGDWFANWEQECTMSLLSERDSQTIFIEFLPDDLMKGDLLSRYTAYNIGRTGGWLSQNEIRQRDNMNDFEGGDTYLTPLNMTATGDAEPNADDPKGDDVDDDEPDPPTPPKKKKPAPPADEGTDEENAG